VSFALYLVHVPLLYTLVATARVHLDLPVPVLAVGYVLLSFGLAHLLTVAVDEPNLRLLKRLRPRLRILEPWGAISRAR
jgi:peptidoglycan/LPS O-acetylase OafA/YrhL